MDSLSAVSVVISLKGRAVPGECLMKLRAQAHAHDWMYRVVVDGECGDPEAPGRYLASLDHLLAS